MSTDDFTTAAREEEERHGFTRVGPGIPACKCGQVFEWAYEHSGHVSAHASRAARAALTAAREARP